MGDRFENTAEIVIPALDDYIRTVTKTGGTRRALASELAKKIVEEYEGSSLGGEERTIQAAIADAKQVASEAIQEEQTARQNADTTITADLAKKAYADGEYADLHAGTANQILSDTYTTDEEPYHYRATPSHAGTREMDEIVGGSVVWNQLVNTSTSSVTVTSGHKYVAKISDAWSVGASTGMALSVTGGTDMVFDITQMLPTTIADHIYDLEQATAGAGVEFFRKYFPEEYYAYDLGTIRSVEGLQSHVTTGFNQWDEEWELGALNATTGEKSSSASSIRSKNFIPVFGNTVYYGYYGKTGDGLYALFYDENKAYINLNNNAVNITNHTFTTPTNARYMLFRTFASGVTTNTYDDNICINLSNTAKNGTYEPYEKHTYPLDNSVTLRGIPQLVDGKLKFGGDIYPPSGLIARRYGIVDLGTLTYGKNTASSYTYYSTGENAIPDRRAGSSLMICAKYITVSPDRDALANADKTLASYNSGNSKAIAIRDDSYSDANALKTALSRVYLIYELATPTTEQAEPYQALQICSPYGTEEYVSTSIVPIGHYTKYPTDLKGIVEQIADAPSADGSYMLKATVSGGVATYSWESA